MNASADPKRSDRCSRSPGGGPCLAASLATFAAKRVSFPAFSLRGGRYAGAGYFLGCGRGLPAAARQSGASSADKEVLGPSP